MATAKLLIQPVHPNGMQEFSWLQEEPLVASAAPLPQSHPVVGIVSIGRAPDNRLCLPDRRIEAYHAIIEEQGGQFLVSPFPNTSGEMLVNGSPLHGKTPLRHGDIVTLAQAFTLTLQVEQRETVPYDPAHTLPAASAATAPIAPAASVTAPVITPVHIAPAAEVSGTTAAGAGLPWWTWPLVAGVLLAVCGGGWLLWQRMFQGKACGPLQIASPADGTSFSSAIAIQVRVAQADCVGPLSLRVDDVEFGSAAGAPWEAMLDPQQLQLPPGEHVVTVVPSGTEAGAPRPLRLIYRPAEAGPSLEEIKTMASLLARSIAANGGLINFEAAPFLEAIRAATATYRQQYSSAVYERAKQHAAQIRKASEGFHSSSLGMVLAFSRSLFDAGAGVSGCGVAPDGVGLYRLPRDVAKQKANAQLPEAHVALSHLKELLPSIGPDSDILYAIACFGETNQRVGELGALLSDPLARRNFWANSSVLTEDERQRVICFLAAGIVAENPERFGLSIPSLKELYN